MFNKVIEIACLSIFIIGILIWISEPTTKDLRSCLDKTRTEVTNLAKNQKERGLSSEQQCREIEPLMISFNQCLDGVKDRHGVWATETVFKIASLSLGANRKFEQVKTECADHLIFLKGLP